MSRIQPGTVILDQLRDRIVTGLYFGNWQPGERLPSIRDIADAEAVDRKTAAAAYHRLEEEGLVEVKARSGVFLRSERTGRAQPAGPLEQLQHRWLKNTYEGGRALGIDTAAMLRLFEAVTAVEAAPLPVVAEDAATARTVAAELRACLAVDARPAALQQLSHPEFRSAALIVTTPYYAADVAALAPGTPLITATLSLDPLHGLMERVTSGMILVVVPSEWIAGRVQSALRQRAPNMERTHIVVASRDADLRRLRSQAASVFVWPGCDDVLVQFEGDDCVKPVRLVSEATLDRVRALMLETALRRVRHGRYEPGVTGVLQTPRAPNAARTPGLSRSSDGGARSAAAVSAG